MKIGILETGRSPETLQPEWGTYADMVRTMLGQDRDYRVYDVQAGELPTDPGECGAYVITGSSAGAFKRRNPLGAERPGADSGFQGQSRLTA